MPTENSSRLHFFEFINLQHLTAKSRSIVTMLTRFYLYAFLAAIIASTALETNDEVAPTLDDSGGKPDKKATNHGERAMMADWTDDWWETYNPTKRPTRRPTTWKRPTRRPTDWTDDSWETYNPTKRPTRRPTTWKRPTRRPTRRPTWRPTRKPVGWTDDWGTPQPTRRPTKKPWSWWSGR